MRAPDFWRQDGFIAHLLLPLSVFFYLYTRLRAALATPVRVGAPVICIGNAVAGGAGKTPCALAIAALLRGKKKKIAFVSKGYGGYLQGPVRVDPERHTAAQVGDEPLLLARSAPCWVGKNRVRTARAAIRDGAGILILDDGLQDPSLHKDVSLLVVDGGYGFGNRLLIPAGPLRGKLADMAGQCAAAILVGRDRHELRRQLQRLDLPVLGAELKPAGKPRKGRYVAFAGIAHPEKFSATLAALDLTIAAAFAYGDHHRYSRHDLAFLKRQSEAFSAPLITTEKDAVRLPSSFLEEVTVLPVEMVFRDAKKLSAILRKA